MVRMAYGVDVGVPSGVALGSGVGVGVLVGRGVGVAVGSGVGSSVGSGVGSAVGSSVGSGVGSGVAIKLQIRSSSEVIASRSNIQIAPIPSTSARIAAILVMIQRGMVRGKGRPPKATNGSIGGV